MRFDLVTLFPGLFGSYLDVGLLGQASKNGKIEIRGFSPREFASDLRGSVDDTPYGGGSGMVMRAAPIVETLEWLDACDAEGAPRARRILLTPQGKPFTQETAQRLSREPALRLVCGRYEGFDERIRSFVDEEISLGDFVLMGGEIAALAVIEAVARLVPGVLGNLDSTHEESHSEGLLEYPQYTRPPEFRGMPVPTVLLSGDHGKISRFRRTEALIRTRARRPDLFAKAALSRDDEKALRSRDEVSR
jgi:tRNA (guanine37-N1)-methyltransferase